MALEVEWVAVLVVEEVPVDREPDLEDLEQPPCQLLKRACHDEEEGVRMVLLEGSMREEARPLGRLLGLAYIHHHQIVDVSNLVHQPVQTCNEAVDRSEDHAAEPKFLDCHVAELQSEVARQEFVGLVDVPGRKSVFVVAKGV